MPRRLSKQQDSTDAHRSLRHTRIAALVRDFDLYLLLLPGLVVLFIFRYIPMYGIVIAFKDFGLRQGIMGSPWVGLKHFAELFRMEGFAIVLRNTLVINLYKYTFSFSAPIVLALLINEVVRLPFKKVVQTIVYLPHFLSWVVAAGMTISILSTSGVCNRLLGYLGVEPVFFLGDKRYFRGILVVTEIWKTAGYGCIIYLAALSGVDGQLYEAAIIDGAGKWRQLWHITLPGITNTIIILMILSMGYILDAGHEQILMLYNPMVYEVGDVLTTYIYRKGINLMQYSFTTAVGLFKSVIGFSMILLSNRLARKYSDYSIW